MKIFIGGMRAHHAQRFEREFPEVQFEFATLDESGSRWFAKARRCDYVLVDQSRCDHKIADTISRLPQLYFIDSKQRIREIIKEIIDHGTATHHYT